MPRKDTPPIPDGSCQCGCGEQTRLAPRTDRTKGWVKGVPLRFRDGHSLLVTRNPEDRGTWKGGETMHGDGYRMIYAPDHPAATPRHPHVFEHRLVAEAKIGRFLRNNEVVHHINDNRADNRPENLQVMTRGEHRRLHAALKRAAS